MNLAAKLEIIPKLMQSYVTGFRLNSINNSTYFMAFLEVLVVSPAVVGIKDKTRSNEGWSGRFW
jgi:hypothetical protein